MASRASPTSIVRASPPQGERVSTGRSLSPSPTEARPSARAKLGVRRTAMARHDTLAPSLLTVGGSEVRVLVTGGAGFIGSHLAEELLARGHTVHVLDDLSTGSIENIRHLRHEPRFGYTIDSCHDSRVVAEVVDEADYVYHLAAAVGVQLIVDSPVRTIETNVHCTEIVLRQASKKCR